MKRETCRSIGALTGLAMGWALMWMLPWRGLGPAFIFGIVGTLSGSLSAERWFDRRYGVTRRSHGKVQEQVKHD